MLGGDPWDWDGSSRAGFDHPRAGMDPSRIEAPGVCDVQSFYHAPEEKMMIWVFFSIFFLISALGLLELSLSWGSHPALPTLLWSCSVPKLLWMLVGPKEHFQKKKNRFLEHLGQIPKGTRSAEHL